MDSSLRTRRPSQAPRKPAQRSQGKPTKQTNRDARKSRVDDKIKKRMSMRYADISSPTELSAIPAVPSIPGVVSSPQRIRGEPSREDEDLRDRSSRPQDGSIKSEDKKLLSSENFDADAFIKIKLANSTEAELRSLQSSLHAAKGDTASDLQRSVFKNYAEFVLISKEISVLENEMLELKDLLSDYKSMPSMLHIPDPTSSSTGTLSTYKRSSVADLRILYFNQMQALHASIEGAAKFVPTTPGRHVVGEMEGVYSLNAATYKIIGKVKFVILDDAVLVARRRRRNAGAGDRSTASEGKLVAEKCWPLSDMLVLDTKDSPNMTNVFKIRQGKETHVYRTEVSANKKSLLSQFRQVADELAAKKRKEREGEHERRKSMWQGGDRSSPAPPPMPEWMVDIAKRGGDIPGANNVDDAKEKAERDARWVGEWSDDLTVAIALREWVKAADLIEQGQARLPITPLLQSKLPTLRNQLTTSLLASLSLPSNKKSTSVTLISLLVRLKAPAAARKTFLEMRTRVITGLMRRIRFEGDISSYVGDLSVVWFTGIKHTADWYLASFKDNESASAFVVWAQNQLTVFGEMFRKQVYTKDVESGVVQEAIAIARMESRKLLQEHGLDFRHLLDQLLVEKPKETTKGSTHFSLAAHRMSKQGDLASLIKQLEPSLPKTQSLPQPLEKGQLPQIQQLPPAPPPTLSAPPPPTRRRTPVPPSAFKDNALSGSRSDTPPPNDTLPSPRTPQPHPPPTYPTSFTPPASTYPNRSRMPVSTAIDANINALSPPTPLSNISTPGSTSITGLASPNRRARSPPPSAGLSSGPIPPSLIPGTYRPSGSTLNPTRDRTAGDRADRDWDPASSSRTARSRAARGGPAPGSLPPRSVNRPGSQLGSNGGTGQQTPRGVVPQREGMI